MTDAGSVLHLFANYKWTGPADPAIRTAARLQERGLPVAFAQAGWTHPGGEHRIAMELQRRGLPVVTGLELRKHFHLRSLCRDAAELRRILARDRWTVLHSHQTNDHLMAAMALRGMAAAARPLLVRTVYEPEGLRGLRSALSLRHTDGVVVPTRAAARALTGRFAFPPGRVLLQEPVTEPRELAGPDLRARWGLGPEHLAVGITARIQPHRRFDLLWRAARRVVDAVPRARFVLLGRGNAADTERLVREPIRRLGLLDHVVLPGYLREPDYSAALRSLQVFLFLVPGSDGTCRAVREAMAAGLPVVATRRGILPELVRARPGGEVPGALCDETEADLGGALIGLLRDEARRRTAGAAALERARTDMDPVRAAAELAAFYHELARRRADRDRDAPTLSRWWREVRGTGRLPADATPVRTRLVRAVGRAGLPSGDAFLKLMTFPRWKDRLRYLLRPVPAVHEGRMLARVAAAGIPCPEVVAVRTARRVGLPRRSLLVLRALSVLEPHAGGTRDDGSHADADQVAERAALALRLWQAGLVHGDLNRDNFVRLRDGRLAVLDLQSARPAAGPGDPGRLQMAARLLWGLEDAAPTGAALVGSGLVAADELPQVRGLARDLRLRWLAGRVLRCLRETTEFARRIRWGGIEHRLRGDLPPGRWLYGGNELLRAWVGQRALQVLEGRPPSLVALFRRWPWFRAACSVYIPAGLESTARSELQLLQEGFVKHHALLSRGRSVPGALREAHR